MARQVGLLTRGSFYLPTPSQPFQGQWPAQLAFVPAHSGASVRELHPLPVSVPYLAASIDVAEDTTTARASLSRNFSLGGDLIAKLF
jgi:hypothetical protein